MIKDRMFSAIEQCLGKFEHMDIDPMSIKVNLSIALEHDFTKPSEMSKNKPIDTKRMVVRCNARAMVHASAQVEL